MLLAPITFGSVCSGIEAASEALVPLGWQCAFVAETDPACAMLLAHHYGSGRPQNMPSPDEAGLKPKEVLRRRAAIRAVRNMPELTNGVPNLGDLEQIDGSRFPALDVLIGGTPCQSFSLAGKRLSLADARGNLALSFVRLAHAIDAVRSAEGERPLVVAWENVPGVLSTDDNAFGCLLSGFVGCDTPIISPLERGRWPDSGLVAGPLARVAWRVLDAQFFGLAQRRERVLVVVSFRDGPDPVEILLEPGGVRRDPPSRQEARENAARAAAAGAGVGGGASLIPPVAHTLDASDGGNSGKETQRTFIPEVQAFGGNNSGGAIDVSTGFSAHHGRMDFATETILVAPGFVPDLAPPLLAQGNTTGGHRPPGSTVDTTGHLIVEPIPILEAGARAGREGHEGRDGMGIGEPGDPMFTLQASKQHAILFDPTQITNRHNRSNPKDGDPSHTLPSNGHPPVIAFTSKDHGQDASEDISPTLRGMNHIDGNANGGGQVAIAEAIGFDCKAGGNTSFAIQDERAGALRASHGGGHAAVAFKPAHFTRGKDGAPTDLHPALSADADKGDQEPVVLHQFSVRRLLPVECERLQGFRDGHTDVPGSSDSARYRQLGNSMPRDMIEWLGRRIEAAIMRWEAREAA